MPSLPHVAALYDIHGNVDALDAALAEIERAGTRDVVVGGDVAYGPFVPEAIDRLMALGERAHWIRGNADRELIESIEGRTLEDESLRQAALWEASRLTEGQRRRLTGLPTMLEFDLDGLGRALFCHASPRSDEEIVTRLTPVERLRPILSGIAANVVVCGHVHVAFDRTTLGIRIVNPGSVGLPYDGQGAAWLELGPDVVFHRAPYDREAAIRAIRASGHPLAASFAEGLEEPPTAEDVTAHFEAIAQARDLRERERPALPNDGL